MKTAIVTGAGSGIGRATALKLAAMKYSVALAGRTAATLDKVAAEIRAAAGPEPLVVPTDVSHAGLVSQLVARVQKEWQRIDVLVNNAGFAPSIATHQVTPEQWHEILNANLSSAFYALHSVWPVMTAQTPRGGTIVNISSMAVKDPFPGLGVYAVAKAGLNMLTLSAAREGDAVGIRVVGIAPGMVDTPMLRGLIPAEQFDLTQVLDPAHLAAAIAAAIEGDLRFCSGDTIYIHRRPT